MLVLCLASTCGAMQLKNQIQEQNFNILEASDDDSGKSKDFQFCNDDKRWLMTDEQKKE